VADLGAGAGVPGLPLAIAMPDTRFALVESVRRKCEFIDVAIATCGIVNASAVNARAEAWPDGIGRFDVVTARAVAPLAVVAEYAAPLLRLGGTAVIWRGRRDSVEEAAALGACRELGLEPQEVRRVRPYPGAEHRHLHLTLKVMETPERFPRRPGIAAKRPLGPRMRSTACGSDRLHR
jgi:16S rRNA (guanine527-N7)-methyltransferase